MGANAQTTVPTFTASQVLTADQQNQSARTGVPVFATTITRDAAFGGSGEKTLAEGQLAYVEGTGLQTYNGSSWVTWGAAPSTGALIYLTGAAFTTQTSVSLPASTFTSTYRNYRVIFQVTAVTADSDFTLRLRASGSDDSTANYRTAGSGINSSASAVTRCNNLATSFTVGESDNTEVAYSLVLDVISPQVATDTNMHGGYCFFDKPVSSGYINISVSGNHQTTTQFDSLSFISSVASSITGIYRVYAYADS